MNQEPHIFQFISACIEKAISLGYEYDQEKSLQVIHDEAKHYLMYTSKIECRVNGVYDKQKETLTFKIRETDIVIHGVEPNNEGIIQEHHITEDGILYRIEA